MTKRYLSKGVRMRAKALTIATLLFALAYLMPQIAFADEAKKNAEQTTKAQKKAEKKEKPLKIKPLKIESEDGLASIQFGLAAQIQYDSTWANYNNAHDAPMAHGNKIRIRRLQPLVKGHFFTKNLTYKFMIEPTPSKVDIMDLFLDYKFHRHARLRAGLGKVGFTRKRLNSWKNQSLVDFSIAPRYFGSERQLGLTLHNGFGKKTTHEYELGIYTGQQSRPGCAKGLTYVSNERMTNPSLIATTNENGKEKQGAWDEVHPELVGHYAYNHNNIDVTTETDWAKTGFRFSIGAGLSFDPRPHAYRDYAMRTGFEFMTKFKGWSFFATHWSGWYDKSGAIGDDGQSKDFNWAIHGFFAQTGYLLFRDVEFAIRYAYMYVNDDFRKDVKARAQAMLAKNPESGVYDKALNTTSDLKEDHELVAGINYYPFGRHVKIATDFGYLFKKYACDDDPEKNLRLRLLMQFYF